ncbi:LWR-salt protein [Halomicrobium sp. LC1Hm]|uniref:LWR-salt protein n=1 Tax=Halomicrobium sp. LC1Hm TaxID=2610902 RepID=UPI0012984316|nr:LWR-salt protein [Halomicrobium sp. LC1Hm]QGA81720.1 Uncharacterized protein LC1Hm_0656 [Halomicrobium sp. LC1Hm]
MSQQPAGGDGDDGSARYVFRATVRLDPDRPDLTAEPSTVETVLYKEAAQPGDDGWLFFRDNCWRGELNDPAFLRTETEDALGVPVDDVRFQELQTDEAYLAALKAAIADDLALFNAESVTEVLRKYLGSSIRVTSE